jgi:hypothetical protein
MTAPPVAGELALETGLFGTQVCQVPPTVQRNCGPLQRAMHQVCAGVCLRAGTCQPM